MLTKEEEIEFEKIFKGLAKNLDITREQHESAVKSYNYVGEWLSQTDSPLYPYVVEVRPQGSFLIGTITQAVTEDGEIDIDLVCMLKRKQFSWTQADLKKIVGDRIKDHGTFKRMLRSPEGRRCWTLDYADTAKFHMDILPCLIAGNYQVLMERKFSSLSAKDVQDISLRITDNQMLNYYTATDPVSWLLSNPFGYALWFFEQASLSDTKLFSLRESIRPVPQYQQNKLPLQVIVQLLKRHRDLMFDGDEHRPISIIITTLAAKAYRKQSGIVQGLIDVAGEMKRFIEERVDPSTGRRIKWVPNPVNPAENFADKWAAFPAKEQNFYNWLSRLENDLRRTFSQRGMSSIHESLAGAFGKRAADRTFSDLGNDTRLLREAGGMSMAAGTGIITGLGRASILNHTNRGEDA